MRARIRQIVYFFLVSLILASVILRLGRGPIEDVNKYEITTVRIGVISASSEDYPKYEFFTDFVEDEINEYCIKNELPYRFNFTLSDARGLPDEALKITQRYYSDGIRLVVGYGWSSQLCCGLSRTYANEHGMILISPSSTSPSYNLEDNVYRLSPNDDLEWRAMANILSSAGVKHILLVGQQYSWFQYVANETIKTFENHGGSTLLVSKLSFNASLSDVKMTLEEMDEVFSGSLEGIDRGKIAIVYSDFPDSWSVVGSGGELLKELKDHPRLLNITWFG